MWAAQETVDLIHDASVYKEHLKSVFCINREIVNTAIGRDVAKALEQSDVPVFKTHISQRVSFAESVATGQTVFEINTDLKAIAEITSLADEILSILPIGTFDERKEDRGQPQARC